MPQARGELGRGTKQHGSNFTGINARKTGQLQLRSSFLLSWHVKHEVHTGRASRFSATAITKWWLPGTSRDETLVHLLRCLLFIEAHYQCYLYPTYIHTKANHLADDLSRNSLSSFLSKVPQANPR